MNLLEALQNELRRNRELLEQYQKIGRAGMFGELVIREKIKQAEAAIASGDIVAMTRCYQELQNSK